jgi:hypothetical protein
MTFVVDDERFHAFDVDPVKLRAALTEAGYKVGVIADHVPYDLKGKPLDGPKVLEIVQAIKEGRKVAEKPVQTKPKPVTEKAPAKKPVKATKDSKKKKK